MDVSSAVLDSEASTESVDCNICGSAEYEVLFPPGVAQRNQVVRYRSCGLMYASPRHKLVDSKDYERYELEGLLLGVDTNRDHPYRWRYDKERFQRQDYDQTKRFLNEQSRREGGFSRSACADDEEQALSGGHREGEPCVEARPAAPLLEPAKHPARDHPKAAV